MRVEHGEACMTWAEIAAALGYADPEGRGRKAVFMVYRNALVKLRNRPGIVERLHSIARVRAAFQRERRMCQSRLGGTRA